MASISGALRRVQTFLYERESRQLFQQSDCRTKPFGQVFVVATTQQGLAGNGVVRPQHFFPHFSAELLRLGHSLETVTGLRDLRQRMPDRPAAFILIRNSVNASEQTLAEADDMEALIRERSPASMLWNSSRSRVLRDKQQANAILSAHGVTMPPLAAGAPTERVFSNERSGSKAEVMVYGPGETLPPERYNTRYINTVQAFGGRQYHVALRAMSVGGCCMSLLIRARDAGKGSPSVHNANTPRDAALLNHLYYKLALPNLGAIARECRLLDEAVGPGFFSLDLLPCADTGTVYVSEAGGKLQDSSYWDRVRPIARDLRFGTGHSVAEIRQTAHAFANRLRAAATG